MRTSPVFLTAFAALASLTSGCSSEKRAAAPPKPGTTAHSWYTAGEAWKSAEYVRTMEHLSRLTAGNNEFRERARPWLVLVAGGVADGYLELSNAYETGARANPASAAEFRRQLRDVRNAANTAALQYAETVHEILSKENDLKLAFEVPFPAGESATPPQLIRITKGFPVQQADHPVLREAMARRGVVKFATAISGASDDPEKARTSFAGPPREAALIAVADRLIRVSDLYCDRKMDMPKRGHALCNEALAAIRLLPDSKQRKELEARAQKELKRFKIPT